MSAEPTAVWELHGGTALAFAARSDGSLTRPVVLAGDAGTKAEDLAAAAGHPAFPLLDRLREHGRDLVLVGLDADGSMTAHGGVVEQAVLRAAAERPGSGPLLAVGGTGAGALAARYALAALEYRTIDHRTGVLFLHNAAAPALEDEAELSRMGGVPHRPAVLRMVDAGTEDGLAEDDVDLTLTGAAGAAGPLLSGEYGSWLLERLP